MRLEALAGNMTLAAEDDSGDEFLVGDDESEEDDDDDSATEDGLSVSDNDTLSVDDMNNEDTTVDLDESTVDDGDSDDDTDESDEEDIDSEEEEEFDEDAYVRQLEEEAFEVELRRITMDALEKGKTTSRSGKVSEYMPTGSQFIRKKQHECQERVDFAPNTALGGMEGINFNLLKKGNKGKMEAKAFVVPKDTNLAVVASKQDDEAERERSMIKARVLQYEAEIANSDGNVYLEQEKLQFIRNRPLSMEQIDQNFGTSGGNLVTAPSKRQGHTAVNQRSGGRGRGRGRFSGRGLRPV